MKRMKEKFKIGDNVWLKTPIQGRRYAGKVTKIMENNLRVTLPNGMYAELDVDQWELTESED